MDAAPTAAEAVDGGSGSSRGGRIKQKARPREQTNRFTFDDPAPKKRKGIAEGPERMVVKRKKQKKAAADADTNAEGSLGGGDAGTVTAHAIPISDHSKRVLLGQVSLNKHFKKSYAARDPPKTPPVGNWTLGNAFHTVCSSHFLVQ